MKGGVSERVRQLAGMAAASRPRVVLSGYNLSHLHFRIAATGLAIESRSLAGIAPLQRLEQDERLGSCFAGLAFVHGRLLPVLDLARRLGLEEGARGERKLLLEVILHSSPYKSFATMADSILGVECFRPDDIHPPDHRLRADCLLGWVRRKGRVSHLLKVSALLTPEDYRSIEPLLC
jgi:chemotaxis signal transduction protein